MQFSMIAAFFVAATGSVMAAPSAGSAHNAVEARVAYPAPPGDVTVGQAGDTCGEDLELSCCNDVNQSGDAVNTADGLLAGVANGLLEGGKLGLFDGCSKLSVTALIGVNDLLNQNCKQNVACCQKSGQEQEGLVNVGLPCVALGSVL